MYNLEKEYTDNNSVFDLLIIGYGMVGSMAALLAVKQGLKVAVLEIRKSNDLYVPKAARVDAEVLRIFEILDLGLELEKLFKPLTGTEIVDKKGTNLINIFYPTSDDKAPMYSMHQPDVQSLLHNKLNNQKPGNFILFEQHKAEAFEQHKDRVNVVVHDISNDIYFNIKTRFLMACNGQESLVPAQCDLDFEFLDYTNYCLNIDTVSFDDFQYSGSVKTYVDTKYPLTAIIDSPRHQRWEFRISPDDMTDRNIYKKVRAVLEEILPVKFDTINTYLYRYETRILNQWQLKRIYITGDAAHVIPPYLGMGLSSGIKDVFNLVWKLGLVAERKTNGKILDTYQKEREASVRSILKNSLKIQKFFSKNWKTYWKCIYEILPRALSKKRIELYSKIQNGLIGYHHKLKGSIVPNFFLNQINFDNKTSIGNIVNYRFAIVAINTDPVDALTPSNIVFAAKLSFRFIQVLEKKHSPMLPRYSECFYDRETKMINWLRKNKVKYLLLRPDLVIFDAAENVEQLNKALKTLKLQMPLRSVM